MKKLQAEIDRVLKKVSEGVETFDSIYDKIQSTNNTNQKEKYEQDLKKEIKKLQRLRDQIKTWLSSNDVKDKSALLENRKLIESEMERFKTVEREMKTKAFSKEGLLQRERLDPKEKEKADAVDWITNTVDELSRQIEFAEAEIETMQGTTKRGKKDHAKAERISELEHFIERNRWHTNRLELVLRLLENGQLPAEKVVGIQDDVQYYLECNQEPDFEEDEYIYDDLNLEAEEALYNVRTEDQLTPSVEEDKQVKEEEPPIKPSKTPASIKPASTPQRQNSLPIKPAESPTSTPKYAQAAATVAPTVPATVTTVDENKEKPAEPTKVVSAWAEPIKIVEQPKQSPQPLPQTQPQQQPQVQLSQPLQQQQQQQQSTPGALPKVPKEELPLPPSLADLASSFEAIKSRTQDPQYTNRMLESSLQFVPDLIDSERPKVYQPQTPQITPSYYPQQPLAIFENPSLFEKFDMDALFFIFYYQQGTYQQYLAARELKKQSWRFHKKYLTWFQRHEEPKVITDDYEQGTYIYFDYENAWCQRKKTEFRFEYRYLEDA
ncbi:proteinral negative regulator of transcription subunit 5 [Rhizopus azygosporus]|uniref:Proteinral negative regulator of transcription subunit 5 n=1 Tax=Rhizopus azygosporus TaxID=86630 RepID=A0A367JBP8_RHIAZ|nr:proteinral negative regulator of transcription subunit 5 [Rhizopus azygosporus]